ncbi:fimbrial protein [Cupriavidus sp. 2TAF22]|uniref:fimbrial protein n=1 Tax=unclassified Cupriavidus TaxID=2640874 RepID=UPI003F90415B
MAYTIVVAFAAMLLSPAHALAAHTEMTAFGSDMALPASSGEGTVLARTSFSPQQLCGAPTCPSPVASIWVWDGQNIQPGPVTRTGVAGVGVRFVVNGSPLLSGMQSPPTISQPVEVQLVRTSGAMGAGSLAGGASTFLNLCASVNPGFGDSCYDASGANYAKIRLGGTIKPIALTCQTPNQSVSLPPAQRGGLTGVGSSTGEIGFTVRLNNCPPGYNRIGYTLDPVGGMVANAPGALPARPGSTASGINIRLTDDAGTPVTFGASTPVGAYDKTTGGSYSIPMRAAYLQTGASVTVGRIIGAATVLVNYQ